MTIQCDSLRRSLRINAMEAIQKGPFILMGSATVVILVVSIFGFGGNQSEMPLEIHFGMAMDPSKGPSIKVWTRIPLLALVETKISNASKIQQDGTLKNIDLLELFPSGDEVNRGIVFAGFTITLINPADEPYLNHTIPMVPMAYTRDLPVSTPENILLMVSSFSVNNWSTVNWALIMVPLAFMGIGVFYIVRNSKKDDTSTPVEPMDEINE